MKLSKPTCWPYITRRVEIPPPPDDEHVYQVEEEWTCREHDQPIPKHWSPYWFEDCTCDRAEWKPTGRFVLTLNTKGFYRMLDEEYGAQLREEMNRTVKLLQGKHPDAEA